MAAGERRLGVWGAATLYLCKEHFTSLRQPQVWPLYREVAPVIRRCHNSNSNWRFVVRNNYFSCEGRAGVT